MSDTPTKFSEFIRNASEQTRRCEWCGEIAQNECGCEAETEIARLREALHRISLGSQDSGTSKASLGKEARAALDAAIKDTK
jgi:hypothetical protein